MKLRIYPTKAARDAVADNPKAADTGRERSGQYLSLAPGGHWVIPHPREAGDPKVAWLAHRSSDGSYYVITSEQTR